MKKCKICGKPFDPKRAPETPAEQAGEFLSRERFDDAGQLCPECLANRGQLGMMYLREYD